MSKVIWSREESRERFPFPVTPLGWSLLRAPLEATLQEMENEFGLTGCRPEDLVRKINGYAYTRKGFFRSPANWRFKPARLLALLANISAAIVRAVLIGAVKRSRQEAVISFFASVLRGRFARLEKNWDRDFKRISKRMATAYSEDLATHSFDAVLEKVECDSRAFFAHDFSVYFLKNAYSLALQKILSPHYKDAGTLVSRLVQGLPDNFSVNMALNQGLLSSDPEKYFLLYGHLTDNWDIAAPVLGEQRDFIERGSGGNLHLLEAFEERRRERETLERELQLKIGGSLWPHLVREFQKLVLIDEDLRALSSRQYPEIKRIFNFAASCVPGLSYEDLLYFDLNEVRISVRCGKPALSRREIETRIAAFARACAQPAPDEIEDGVESVNKPPLHAAGGRETVRVQGLSPGVARGPVLAVTTWSDFEKLTPQHLVYVTNPTPVYAPFFANCAGIISETGGALSHGAIVAREFGIPMVCGLVDRLSAVDDSTWAEINGESGHVEIWRESPQPDSSV